MDSKDTNTLEWLLEKNLGYQYSTMYDDECLNIKDIFENEQEQNKSNLTNPDELNISETADYNIEQKKANVKIKKISDDINTDLKNMYFKHLKTNNTFYKNIYEYHGVVETVDKVNKKFTAILINSNDSEDVLSAEFRLDDINYESDKKLIDVGVNIIWIIGQEQQVISRNGSWVQGTQQNMAKFIVRRSQGLNNKRRREAKDEARKWSELFERFESTETIN